MGFYAAVTWFEGSAGTGEQKISLMLFSKRSCMTSYMTSYIPCIVGVAPSDHAVQKVSRCLRMSWQLEFELLEPANWQNSLWVKKFHSPQVV